MPSHLHLARIAYFIESLRAVKGLKNFRSDATCCFAGTDNRFTRKKQALGLMMHWRLGRKR
jgi:hypothetical protein